MVCAVAKMDRPLLYIYTTARAKNKPSKGFQNYGSHPCLASTVILYTSMEYVYTKIRVNLALNDLMFIAYTGWMVHI